MGRVDDRKAEIPNQAWSPNLQDVIDMYFFFLPTLAHGNGLIYKFSFFSVVLFVNLAEGHLLHLEILSIFKITFPQRFG